MRKLIFISFFVLSQITLINAKNRKAIFVIVDGIPADVIERVPTPAIDEIAKNGGYTRAIMGGLVKGYSQTPTISAVCYNSLLTSTWVNKHNVWNNDVSDPNYNYWSIFRIAESQKKDVKTAIYSTWLDNRTKLVGDGLAKNGAIQIDYKFDGLELDTIQFPREKDNLHIFKIDEAVSKAAAEGIEKQAPDLTWVYLQYTDDAGHKWGDGELFDKYVQEADKQVGRIWEAVKKRQEQNDEEWMVVVLTDHGRNESGYGHGGQTDRERTVWFATNIPGNDYFGKPGIGIIDITPSICNFMNFKVPQEIVREQDGISFVGNTDFYGLEIRKGTGKNLRLSWKALQPEAKVNIYMTTSNNACDGNRDVWAKIGTVKAGDEGFEYNSEVLPSTFYKFVVETKNTSQNVWVNE